MTFLQTINNFLRHFWRVDQDKRNKIDAKQMQKCELKFIYQVNF